MCVCMHVNMSDLCIHASEYVCIYARKYICVCVYMHTHTFPYLT